MERYTYQEPASFEELAEHVEAFDETAGLTPTVYYHPTIRRWLSCAYTPTDFRNKKIQERAPHTNFRMRIMAEDE